MEATDLLECLSIKYSAAEMAQAPVLEVRPLLSSLFFPGRSSSLSLIPHLSSPLSVPNHQICLQWLTYFWEDFTQYEGLRAAFQSFLGKIRVSAANMWLLQEIEATGRK